MRKIFYLICVVSFTMVFYSCETENQQRLESKNDKRTYYVDTLNIHGNDHEIIWCYIDRGGAVIHSPECWCGKNETCL